MAGYDEDQESTERESEQDEEGAASIADTSDDSTTLVPDAVYIRSPEWMEDPPRWYLFCYVDSTKKNHAFSILDVFHRFHLPLSFTFLVVVGDEPFKVPLQMAMQTKGWDEKVLWSVAALHFVICHVGLDHSADSLCFAE